MILPFTVLRRLDCVLDQTKEDVLAAAEQCTEELVAFRRKMLEKWDCR